MRSVRRYLWKLLHQGGLALLLVSLLLGLVRPTRTVSLAYSTARATLPVLPVGATEEEEQEREEVPSVTANLGSSPRRPGRTAATTRLTKPLPFASVRPLSNHGHLSLPFAALPGSLGSGVCLRC